MPAWLKPLLSPRVIAAAAALVVAVAVAFGVPRPVVELVDALLAARVPAIPAPLPPDAGDAGGG